MEELYRHELVQEAIGKVFEVMSETGLNLLEAERLGRCVSAAAEMQILSNLGAEEAAREKVIERLRESV